MIRNLSFGGFYLIKFPKSYPDGKIKEKHDLLNKHIKDNNYIYMDTLLRKGIEPQNSNQSTTDILLMTNLDNTYQIHSTLSVIDSRLADQYIDKTKVYLNLDTIA